MTVKETRLQRLFEMAYQMEHRRQHVIAQRHMLRAGEPLHSRKAESSPRLDREAVEWLVGKAFGRPEKASFSQDVDDAVKERWGEDFQKERPKRTRAKGAEG